MKLADCGHWSPAPTGWAGETLCWNCVTGRLDHGMGDPIKVAPYAYQRHETFGFQHASDRYEPSLRCLAEGAHWYGIYDDLAGCLICAHKRPLGEAGRVAVTAGQGNHTAERNDRRVEVLWSNRPLGHDRLDFGESA